MLKRDPINIVSESARHKLTGGPGKVFENTFKGLERIGYPYVLNQDIRKFKYNWIHDSVKGFIEAAIKGIPCVIGPNIAVLPKDLPAYRPRIKNCIYLHPSPWCVDVWNKMGFNECTLESWPAGIDTTEFPHRKEPSGKDVLVYFKRRKPSLLAEAAEIVRSKGYNPRIVSYGRYNEDEYRRVLSECLFGIWIGVSESQGIALQEALSSGVPLIVLDVCSLFESSDPKDYMFPESLHDFSPTSVPYFDDRCGIIVKDIAELNKAFEKMIVSTKEFDPRSFILENLSLEKQATELLRFFSINVSTDNQITVKNEDCRSGNCSFRLSLRGYLIYMIFIVRRKTRTFLRLLGNRYRTNE